MNALSMNEPSIRSINGVSVVIGRRESGRGGMRSWMEARAVPVVSTRIAGLVDLFRSPSKALSHEKKYP